MSTIDIVVPAGESAPHHRPAPNVHDLTAALVGNTPVLRIGAGFEPGERGYWAKLEGANPGGIKDRAALHMVRRARQRGDLAPAAPIVESTSGTLGLGLALAAKTYGHQLTVVADPGLESAMRRLLVAYGAQVETVKTPDPIGGWQAARRDRVADLLADSPGAWCPDQYHNPDNVDAYEGLALELAFQLGRIDILVCAVGTGGHSAGVFRVLRRLRPDARLVGVDSVASTIFGQPAGPRLMRGLGSSIHPRNVAYDWFSEVHWVPPEAAVQVCRSLAGSVHVTGGWSVGAVALVADWLARTTPSGTRIVAIFPDGPHRYADTVFNDDYCHRHDLLTKTVPDEPAEMAHPSEVVTAWTRSTAVVDPLAGASA